MTTDPTYKCNHCDRGETRHISTAAGGSDNSARVAGWRIGATPNNPRNVICPECAGTDEDYWDRRTLTVAYSAGIDAGNQAWT